jgi:hypothetical protein
VEVAGVPHLVVEGVLVVIEQQRELLVAILALSLHYLLFLELLTL